MPVLVAFRLETPHSKRHRSAFLPSSVCGLFEFAFAHFARFMDWQDLLATVSSFYLKIAESGPLSVQPFAVSGTISRCIYTPAPCASGAV